jgi:hypothetical protein
MSDITDPQEYVTKADLMRAIEQIERIYHKALDERRNGKQTDTPLNQGIKEGTRASLAFLYELIGDTQKANGYRLDNATTPYQRGTVVAWLKALINASMDAVEELSQYIEEEELGRWHPIALARNRLSGQSYGARGYLKQTGEYQEEGD